MNYTRPQLAVALDPIRNAFVDAKNRDVRLRYLTEITAENISFCKELIKIVGELRPVWGNQEQRRNHNREPQQGTAAAPNETD